MLTGEVYSIQWVCCLCKWALDFSMDPIDIVGGMRGAAAPRKLWLADIGLFFIHSFHAWTYNTQSSVFHEIIRQW